MATIKVESLLSGWSRARAWLSESLSQDDRQHSDKRLARSTLLCGLIFFTAFGVRSLHWQDGHVELERENTPDTGLFNNYHREASRIVEQGGILFPREPVDPGDARMILHPPGYSILMAALYGNSISDFSGGRLRLLQIICDSISTVMVFLIAAEMLPLAAAFIAGMLAAFSPHLAYYSLWLSPDSLSVLPVLIAVYLITRAMKRPRMAEMIAAGVFIGLSCWLRSNALLLAPFLALAAFSAFERGKRLRYAAALVASAIVVISPITIRNRVVFGQFIPLSIGAGITMIEGIADYDTDRRFDMPQFDQDVKLKDAEWHGRPDYAGYLWLPDGIERDRARLARGLAVIRSNPGWFSSVMLRRAAFMLRYNDRGRSDWPFGTSQTPVVSFDPGFGHPLRTHQEVEPVWAASPEELIAGGTILSEQATVAVAGEGGVLEVTGDISAFGDQFISAPIPVKKNTDYVLRLSIEKLSGFMAAKVTTPDGRVALASGIMQDPEKGFERRQRKTARKKARGAKVEDDTANEKPLAFLDIPFASDERTEARLTISNNGAQSSSPRVQVGSVELIEHGPTSLLWTRPLRAVTRGIQRNLFTTGRMVPLVFAGIVLTALAMRGRALVILLAVPLYYMSLQSALHTEYRYILAIHYFLFIMAAVALYCIVCLAGRVIYRIAGRYKLFLRKGVEPR